MNLPETALLKPRDVMAALGIGRAKLRSMCECGALRRVRFRGKDGREYGYGWIARDEVARMVRGVEEGNGTDPTDRRTT